MKQMDRPSGTEMDRGGAYGMDRLQSAKNENATEMDKI